MKTPTKTEVLTVLTNLISAEKIRAKNNGGDSKGSHFTIRCIREAKRRVQNHRERPLLR